MFFFSSVIHCHVLCSSEAMSHSGVSQHTHAIRLSTCPDIPTRHMYYDLITVQYIQRCVFISKAAKGNPIQIKSNQTNSLNPK